MCFLILFYIVLFFLFSCLKFHLTMSYDKLIISSYFLFIRKNICFQNRKVNSQSSVNHQSIIWNIYLKKIKSDSLEWNKSNLATCAMIQSRRIFTFVFASRRAMLNYFFFVSRRVSLIKEQSLTSLLTERTCKSTYFDCHFHSKLLICSSV